MRDYIFILKKGMFTVFMDCKNKMEQLITGEFQINKMKELWHNRKPRVIEKVQTHHSSVMLPLIEKNGQLEVVFEVRSSALTRQPGEVCFPGGKVENEESFEATAVRETMEELLIEKDKIEILAPLDYLEMNYGLTVHVYLGALKDYNGSYSEDEVDHVFTVPLSWFLENEPDKYVAAVHTVPSEDFPYELVPGGREYHWSRGKYPVYFYCYREEVIWGMTAKIMYAFVKLCRGECL